MIASHVVVHVILYCPHCLQSCLRQSFVTTAQAHSHAAKVLRLGHLASCDLRV